MKEITLVKGLFEDAKEILGFDRQSSLRKCFITNGFDSPCIIAKIDENDIAKTEEFSKTIL